MKTILLTILYSTLVLWAHAQNDSIRFYANIIDAFTGAIVEDGEADVLAEDSSSVSKGKWRYNTDNNVRTASIVMGKVPKEGKYILRVAHPNYFTVYYPIDIRIARRGNSSVLLPGNIKMRKRPKVTQMNELVVKATKIKMVMRKDTIVYDADAFQLSQGSMLDALIEQLPGAELKENGVITVNGRHVSSLLVNGKDFFKGDPRIALENLPAYMVDKVKVYEQQTDFEKMTGKEATRRPLVMDVNLKHQYSIGWIANAEAGYGTKQKYLGRLFAMRFTDCSRLALFGNINNTNDTRRPGQKGDWTPSYLPDGIQTSKSGGAEYFYENRPKTFEWTSNLDASYSDNNILTHTNGESFLPTDKAYTLSRGNDIYRTTRMNTSHRFKSHNKTERHTGGITFNYDKNRYSAQYFSGEFGEDPYSCVKDGVLDSLFLPDAGKLRQLARYRKRQEAYSRGENWSLSAPYSLWWTPFQSKGVDDMLSFDLAGSYDKHISRSFDNYHVEYYGTDGMPADYRNRHANRPSHHYNYNTRLAYAMFPGAVWPTLTYRYSQDYTSGRKDLYRLDRIDGWGEGTEHELGTLPSSASEMQQALDIQNSEHSKVWKRRHQVELRLEYRRRKTKHQTTVVLTLPVNFELDRLVYDRSERHYDLHRSKTLFTPNCDIQQNIEKGDYLTVFRMNYALSSRQPDLVNTIELINDVNPLYIQTGNASLRRSTSHNLSLTAMTSRKYRPIYNFSIRYHRTHNALATERTYNTATGGYTVRPVNVDGNWSIDGNLSMDRQFGKGKRFTMGSNTSWSYNHNVDMANVAGATTNGLSIIRNMYLRRQMTLGYSHNGWNIGAKARCGYNRINGDRSDFSDICAWDFDYGVNARIPLPWGIGLSTDFTVFSRRGYGDPSLNTNDLVWNMRLERSILNGNLTFAVDGFDMLHDLSKVNRIINAQGRTESYTNVLPSYFMGHVTYRFSKQPKNKKP